ncbi:MAG: hypothetical protein CM1200mP22_16340 [Dehalococcoidia bacterium]|nr:MAG: hypothetical protein CM1200mP22_16340 [Dehalococcoidia bacterium]
MKFRVPGTTLANGDLLSSGMKVHISYPLTGKKRSLTLNFKEEKARDIFLKLVKDADVVVENFTPGVMDRFGLATTL